MTPAKLRKIRARLGMTRRELGAATGYSYRAVVAWEQGWRRVPKPLLRMLDSLTGGRR
ncbi:MAG: helix-turn-helix domain-containing protein [bacterium]|nr:helix-turn-helix domain-containing protein [bacterium]